MSDGAMNGEMYHYDVNRQKKRCKSIHKKLIDLVIFQAKGVAAFLCRIGY